MEGGGYSFAIIQQKTLGRKQPDTILTEAKTKTTTFLFWFIQGSSRLVGWRWGVSLSDAYRSRAALLLGVIDYERLRYWRRMQVISREGMILLLWRKWWRFFSSSWRVGGSGGGESRLRCSWVKEISWEKVVLKAGHRCRSVADDTLFPTWEKRLNCSAWTLAYL